MNTYITHPAAFYNPEKATFNSILSNGHFIPQVWYHKILRSGNKPDSIGITILSELLQLHLSSEVGEREFQLGYSYFKTKFNYTWDQIYEALLRLEKSRLISRKGKPGKNINDLFITLNVETLLALHDEDINQSNLDNHNTSILPENSLNIDLYIDNTKREIEDKREENYISGSEFDKNQSCAIDKNATQTENDPINPPADKTYGIIKTAKKWARSLIRQPMANFHPLSEEEAAALRFSSGREFNLNFINQLVLKLGKKYPNHGFYTKKLFLKYMTAILANEMCQAVNVNNEGFRFRRTDEEGTAEEYLAKVEDSYDTNASDQIRRKVAAAFEPITAYKILTSCYFPDEAIQGKYEIKQRSSLELSEYQRERLFSQISAVFGDRVESIEIIKNFKPVAKLQHISTFKESQCSTYAVDTATIWGRVRSRLIILYGEAVDRSWFSKLETTNDISSRSLVLKGASFLIGYVQTNYSHIIEKLCREENYQLKFC